MTHLQRFFYLFSIAFTSLMCSTSIAASEVVVGSTYQPGMRAADYFERVKQDPQRLLLFLKKMPKGGDLHTHMDGATYAENFIEYAKNDNFCVEEDQLAVSTRVNCLSSNKLSNISKRAALHNRLINAWSMRNFIPLTTSQSVSAHDHFFATFDKFLPITMKYYPDILVEMTNRAAEHRVLYLEMMITPDEYASGLMGKKIKWNDDFKIMEAQLLKLGISERAKIAAANIVDHKIAAEKKLQCGTKDAQPGCAVKVRFLYQVLRNQSPTEVFSQLLTAFTAANQSPSNIVGINMVQAEDGLYSMRDYKLHMKMIEFLKKRNPNVNATLHAGELTSGLVPSEGLQSHIRDAIELGQARRIGHGVSVAHERDADALLKKMAKEHILVEINLTSNKLILDVEGKHHPLSLYLSYGVPVALSTDDEGVLRTDITQEYHRAVSQYKLSYADLKLMARNSIAYSFLAGESLWRPAAQTHSQHQSVAQCAGNELGAAKPSKSCSDFLAKSEKAQTQWALEKGFAEFERTDWGREKHV
jgi:adenosine deaminase